MRVGSTVRMRVRVRVVRLKIAAWPRMEAPAKGGVEGVENPPGIGPCLDAIPYPRGGSVPGEPVLQEPVGSTPLKHEEALGPGVRVLPNSHGLHPIESLRHPSNQVGVSEEREVPVLGPVPPRGWLEPSTPGDDADAAARWVVHVGGSVAVHHDRTVSWSRRRRPGGAIGRRHEELREIKPQRRGGGRSFRWWIVGPISC